MRRAVKKVTATKKSSLEFLIAAGILNKDGTLVDYFK